MNDEVNENKGRFIEKLGIGNSESFKKNNYLIEGIDDFCNYKKYNQAFGCAFL
jgi:hypothetical protein